MVYKRTMGAFYSPYWLIVLMPYGYGWFVRPVVRAVASIAVPNHQVKVPSRICYDSHGSLLLVYVDERLGAHRVRV
jgi:hypothetical protein